MLWGGYFSLTRLSRSSSGHPLPWGSAGTGSDARPGGQAVEMGLRRSLPPTVQHFYLHFCVICTIIFSNHDYSSEDNDHRGKQNIHHVPGTALRAVDISATPPSQPQEADAVLTDSERAQGTEWNKRRGIGRFALVSLLHQCLWRKSQWKGDFSVVGGAG